jgi:Spy/CpxP family protein refolding chaperone
MVDARSRAHQLSGGPMKQIRLIAFVLASMAAAAPLAGAQGAQQGNRHQAGARAQRGGKHGLLRGLNLSAAEKAKVKTVHENYAAQTKPMRESLRPAMQEARADRQKGDTAAARAVFERTKASRESLRTVMEREKSEMRAALTPANQRQFDANVKQAVAARGKKGMGWGGRRAKISNG